ncbi:hypothetical protein N665_5384s0001 [Sinapis alba]|nr:hypothetical protein N665_5384s0001 [Sinapis alba]
MSSSGATVAPAVVAYSTFDSLHLGRTGQYVVGRLIRFWDSKNVKKKEKRRQYKPYRCSSLPSPCGERIIRSETIVSPALVSYEGRRVLLGCLLAAGSGMLLSDSVEAVSTSRRALRASKIPEKRVHDTSQRSQLKGSLRRGVAASVGTHAAGRRNRDMGRLSLTSSIHRLRFFTYLSQHKGRRCVFACSSYGSHYLSSLAEASDYELDECPDDTKVAEKDTNLRSALSQLSVSGVFDEDSKLWLQRFSRTRRVSVISTGSLNLDLALGVGGLPKGRMVEVYGKEASGKTTLALHIIKEAQKLGGYCAYLDVENALDPTLAESIGVNTEELLISRPDSAENMLSIVDVLTKCGSVDVIVVDSVAALVPQCELGVPLGDRYRDRQSIIMTQALRKIHYSVANSRTLIVFLNQVRSHANSNMRFPHSEEVTCGGNALRFQAAIRLKMIRTGLIKTDNEISGLNVCVEVVKNKLTPGKKKSELGIHFGRGFYVEREVLELACEHGVIAREGNSHLIEGEVVDGKDAAEKYLVENKEVLDTVIDILRRQLF